MYGKVFLLSFQLIFLLNVYEPSDYNAIRIIRSILMTMRVLNKKVALIDKIISILQLAVIFTSHTYIFKYDAFVSSFYLMRAIFINWFLILETCRRISMIIKCYLYGTVEEMF